MRRRGRWAAAALVGLALLGLWLGLDRAPTPPGPGGVAQGPARGEGPAGPGPTRPRLARPAPPTARPGAAGGGEADTGATGAGGAGTSPAEEPALATVLVTVRDSRGRPVDGAFAASRDCRRGAQVVGGEAVLELPSGRCTVEVWREDGLLRARSEALELTLSPGQVQRVSLTLPAERTGGLGVQIAAHPEGIRVVRVIPGSPAERFGLNVDDIIVEVDGMPTTELALEEFVDTMTGPEGSRVAFRVTWEGDTGRLAEDLVLERAVLE